jgi:hypothetical protein
LPLRYTKRQAKAGKSVRLRFLFGAIEATVLFLAGCANRGNNHRIITIHEILCGSLSKSGGIGKYFFVFLQIDATKE